jgi:excisionase family DNA binding protein
MKMERKTDMVKFLSIKQLSFYIGISTPTIYKWIENGTAPFPYTRINQRTIRFDIEKINAFMEKQETKPQEVENENG